MPEMSKKKSNQPKRTKEGRLLQQEILKGGRGREWEEGAEKGAEGEEDEIKTTRYNKHGALKTLGFIKR